MSITALRAIRIGHDLALAFTKGRHAFIVATHTDRAHIHNHIIFNSTRTAVRQQQVEIRISTNFVR